MKGGPSEPLCRSNGGRCELEQVNRIRKGRAPPPGPAKGAVAETGSISPRGPSSTAPPTPPSPGCPPSLSAASTAPASPGPAPSGSGPPWQAAEKGPSAGYPFCGCPAFGRVPREFPRRCDVPVSTPPTHPADGYPADRAPPCIWAFLSSLSENELYSTLPGCDEYLQRTSVGGRPFFHISRFMESTCRS